MYKRGRRGDKTVRAWWERADVEAQAERAQRQAEAREVLRRRWQAWVYSAPGTPPSSPAPSE